LNVTEDKELEELEKMLAEMEAVPQHTPKIPDSKSKQREEMILTTK
jgi:hypothetical protein